MSDDAELIPTIELPLPLSPEDERRERNRANLAKARAARGANRASRAASPQVGSPEFQAAVAEAASQAAAKIVAELMAVRGGAPVAAPSSDMVWARQLAQAMAEVADQGTDRKRLAPEVLAQRTEAAEHMQRLIIDARARGDMPLYQLRGKVVMKVVENGRDMGEGVIEPIWVGTDRAHHPTEIDWPGVPNQQMIPLNEAAQRIFDAFILSIGNVPVAKEVEGLAVTAGGAVVRGGAAAALFRATGRAPDMAGPAPSMGDAVSVRRNSPAPTRDIRILGTLHPPARENA